MKAIPRNQDSTDMTTMHPLVEATVEALHEAFAAQYDCRFLRSGGREIDIYGGVDLPGMARTILKVLIGDRLAYQAQNGGVIILGPEGFEFEGDEEALFRLWRE